MNRWDQAVEVYRTAAGVGGRPVRIARAQWTLESTDDRLQQQDL